MTNDQPRWPDLPWFLRTVRIYIIAALAAACAFIVCAAIWSLVT